MFYLKAQENYFNDLLRYRGHLFLNEVYDGLGIPRSKAGQLVGWIYNEDDPSGDNYVDFNIFKTSNVQSINGYENSILLDFNVDGNIFEKLT